MIGCVRFLALALACYMMTMFAVLGDDVPSTPVVKIPYSVRFNANGGTGTMANQSLVQSELGYLSENRFKRPGYAFKGWALSEKGAVAYAEGEGVLDLTGTASAPVTLYAVWEKKTVEYTVSGQIGQFEWVELPCDIRGTISSKDSPAKIEFRPRNDLFPTSASVYTDTGTGAVFQATLINVDVEAMWMLTPSSSQVQFLAGATYDLEVMPKTYRAGAQYVIHLGSPSTYKVFFAGNGGTVSTNSKIYTPGVKYGSFPRATRSGYELLGWYTDATNGVQITSNTVACVGYTTLYARWSANSAPVEPAITNYCVTFNPNGGVGSVVTQLFTYGEAQSLATNIFSRTNFVFSGWSTTAAGSVVYSDRQVVSNLTTSVDGSVSLYAVWRAGVESVKTAVVDGVVWHYVEDSVGSATICNIDADGGYVTVVPTNFVGNLVIPRMFGSNLVVTAIGERAFANCTSVTNIDIPWTVELIGSYAFANCSNLSTGITIPENVAFIGDGAFMNCTGLKIVRYLGGCPETGSKIYQGTCSDLVSGVLKVHDGWTMKSESDTEISNDDEEDESGPVTGGESTTRTIVTLPERWPSGDCGRKIAWWTTANLARIAFMSYDGTGNSENYYFLANAGRVIGDLPDDPEREGYEFLGWYTKPYGGELVEDASDIEVLGSRVFYAHWRKDDDDAPVEYGDVVYDFKKAHVYNGYLLGDNGIAGTILVKAAKGKVRKSVQAKAVSLNNGTLTDGEPSEPATNVSVTATIQLLGEGKKLTYKGIGECDEGVSVDLLSTKKSEEREMSLVLDGNELSGDFDGYAVVGVRNVFSGTTDWDRRKALQLKDDWKGTCVAALAADGESPFAFGHVALSFTIGSKGKVKVTGMMPDGQKVSVSSQLLMTEELETCLIPVVAPLYSGKKGGLGFLLRLGTEGVTVEELSDWRATSGPTAPFSAALTPVGALGAGVVGNIATAAAFQMTDSFDFANADVDAISPDGTEIVRNGAKWVLPRADKVKFVDGSHEVMSENGNPAQLKLSYSTRTGLFKGSFKVYTVTESGRSKRYTATVMGVVLEGIGYGSAVVKDVGSIPVTVEE